MLKNKNKPLYKFVAQKNMYYPHNNKIYKLTKKKP